MHLRYLTKAIQAGLAGHPGDTAAYKAAALGTPAYADLDDTLAQLANPLPNITIDYLTSQPPDSFGRNLAQFLKKNDIRPLILSPVTRRELHKSSVLSVRYPIFHDAFHVLLGFDTSLAGELGVWSFVAAQRYSPAFDRAACVGHWFTRLLIPWQWKRLSRYENAGRMLGKQAVCVIAQPLEEYWAMSLEEVRVRFGLPVGGWLDL
ncbi:MAG: Coq4 family protein [Cyanobacteria bacterium P01_H01_bin.21]